MEYQEVESSNIKALGYKDNILEVKFLNGSVYRYQSVPKGIFHQLVEAASVGRAFNQLIKSQPLDYPFERVN